MRRAFASLLVLAALAASGCGRATTGQGAPAARDPVPDSPAAAADPATRPTDSTPAPAPTRPPAQTTTPAPAPGPGGVAAAEAAKLKLALNQSGAQSPWRILTDFLDQRGNFAEADLDGDGTPEYVAALSVQGEKYLNGVLLVAYRKGGAFEVDVAVPPEGRAASLYNVLDLTGDGRPEIVWVSEDHGAHTAYAYVYVSTWRPGAVSQLPGTMYITTPNLEVEGRDILLHGGMVGSVGAGMAQRPRTDRYRWVGGQFRLVDRRYQPSTYGYHRLIDAITAEGLGQGDGALAGYREAMEQDRPAGPGTDWVPAEWSDRFAAAVRTFSRFRLGALLLQQGKAADAKTVLEEAAGPYAGLAKALEGAGGREPGCKAAEAWAGSHPEFLEALNSPFGYANPKWQPADLCGPLPSGE